MILSTSIFKVLAAAIGALRPTMDPKGAIIGGAVLLLGISVATYLLKRLVLSRMGVMCSFCGHPRAKPLRELAPADAEMVLSYFRQYEKREPDEDGVYVCPDCGIVYDDFSGENRSGEPDAGPSPTGRDLPPGVSGYRAYCKVCGGLMLGIAKVDLDLECGRCETVHKWQRWGDREFVMLVPPDDAAVRKGHLDTGWG